MLCLIDEIQNATDKRPSQELIKKQAQNQSNSTLHFTVFARTRIKSLKSLLTFAGSLLLDYTIKFEARFMILCDDKYRPK